MLPSTHLSVLRALQDSKTQEAAWEKFLQSYQPHIVQCCRRCGLQPADAEDVTQNILLRLSRVLPEHDLEFRKSFRSWLITVVKNTLRNYFRSNKRHGDAQGVGGSTHQQLLADLQAPKSVEDLAGIIEEGWDPAFQEAVRKVKSVVDEKTWRAFYRLKVEGDSGADVAKELALSAAAVYQAKYRVRKLLEKEYNKGTCTPDH